MCTWASTPPGRINKSEASSIIFASLSKSPIADILPLKTPRSQSSKPFSVTICPFLKITSRLSIDIS